MIAGCARVCDVTQAFERDPAAHPRATVIDVPAEDPSGASDALSVLQASQILGVPVSTLRRRIEEGDLPATRDGRAWKISKTVVLQVGAATLKKRESPADRARNTGRLAALAFPLFAASTPLDEVVVKLEADPAAIRALFAEWKECRALSAQLKPTAAGPTFDHAPNATHDCCPGHQALRRAEKT